MPSTIERAIQQNGLHVFYLQWFNIEDCMLLVLFHTFTSEMEKSCKFGLAIIQLKWETFKIKICLFDENFQWKTIKASPPILNTWLCNNIPPIQNYLNLQIRSLTHKHEPRIKKSQNLLITNHVDQSINLINQDQ